MHVKISAIYSARQNKQKVFKKQNTNKNQLDPELYKIINISGREKKNGPWVVLVVSPCLDYDDTVSWI